MSRTASVPEAIAWEKVDAAVAEAAARARGRAETFARGELDTWNAELVRRIDDNFLPWYFGYWNQQMIGVKALWQGAKYELAGYVTAADTPGPSHQMAADLQEEFANRVLRPESAQLFLEQVTRKTVEVYLADLRAALSEVQVTYKIPQPQWERYLQDISLTAARTQGNREVPLSLKAIAGTSVGAGAAATTALLRAAGRFEGKLAGAAVEKAGTRMAAGIGQKVAAKAGGKVAARAGGKLLGPAVAAVVIAWDVYDHHATVKENWPVLRESLLEYLRLMRESLLCDPQAGIAAAMHETEACLWRR
jgi:hypothetical protein